jgi:hypothetical protein
MDLGHFSAEHDFHASERIQTWYATSPKRWKMFLYNHTQNPNSLQGKIYPKNASGSHACKSISTPENAERL